MNKIIELLAEAVAFLVMSIVMSCKSLAEAGKEAWYKLVEFASTELS